jgi:hypothetical protein
MGHPLKTAAEFDEMFKEMAQEFYPGSSKPIIRHPNRPAFRSVTASRYVADEEWDKNPKPKTYKVNGKETQFFGVGNLAKALGRQPVTIRSWEREGVIPKATFQFPSEDPRGRRRLYTREQVEGMTKIASEEGLMDGSKAHINKTQFKPRVVQLFVQLQEKTNA